MLFFTRLTADVANRGYALLPALLLIAFTSALSTYIAASNSAGIATFGRYLQRLKDENESTSTMAQQLKLLSSVSIPPSSCARLAESPHNGITRVINACPLDSSRKYEKSLALTMWGDSSIRWTALKDRPSACLRRSHSSCYSIQITQGGLSHVHGDLEVQDDLTIGETISNEQDKIATMLTARGNINILSSLTVKDRNVLVIIAAGNIALDINKMKTEGAGLIIARSEFGRILLADKSQDGRPEPRSKDTSTALNEDNVLVFPKQFYKDASRFLSSALETNSLGRDAQHLIGIMEALN